MACRDILRGQQRLRLSHNHEVHLSGNGQKHVVLSRGKRLRKGKGVESTFSRGQGELVPQGMSWQ